MAAWAGGAGEGRPDINSYGAKRSNGKWRSAGNWREREGHLWFANTRFSGNGLTFIAIQSKNRGSMPTLDPVTSGNSNVRLAALQQE